ncbi:DUF6928 family protein [Pseudoduganella aquatica]|uniref:Uncharacterized protein n=1 Tax=Pseudoduganella aquatica TaxID=2660641 RepID=A0A7X4HEV2_9BURK|nr:hypothetical protein [Pseudoduganella aquatica]MYN09963.1 hypothetical protein [Pseudoduganella aquatica]
MGAKTWMLVYSKGNPVEILMGSPALDRDATIALAKRLFVSERLEPLGDGDLSSTCPADDVLVVGCFPGLTVVAAKEFGIDYPSRLPAKFLEAMPGHGVYLHAMHSVVDWFAYAVWADGKLQRSLSLSPDSGVLEDIGERQSFEAPYWDGEHPAVDSEEDAADYPFVFHPLDMGEAALLSLFGYQLEGMIDPTHLQPESIPLMRFKRRKSWWRFGWRGK